VPALRVQAPPPRLGATPGRQRPGAGRRARRTAHSGQARTSAARGRGGCGIVGSRKKLRLSKDQAAVLEDSFREHPTLNPVTVSNHHPVRQEQTTHQWMNSGPQSFTSKLADLDLNRAALWRAAAEGSLSRPR